MCEIPRSVYYKVRHDWLGDSSMSLSLRGRVWKIEICWKLSQLRMRFKSAGSLSLSWPQRQSTVLYVVMNRVIEGPQ